MKEAEFRAELADIRRKVELVLSLQPTVGQLAALGSEMEAQTRTVLDQLAGHGVMGFRPWV